MMVAVPELSEATAPAKPLYHCCKANNGFALLQNIESLFGKTVNTGGVVS